MVLSVERAKSLDKKIKEMICRERSTSLKLGAALCRIKETRAYRTLGFTWFQDYVAKRGISISYAERVMRAYRYACSDKCFNGLSVDQILFVVNVSSRANSGKSRKAWADFARDSSMDDRAATKKALTRRGVLPSLPTGRDQAIKYAPVEPSVDMTIRVTRKTRKLFEEQKDRWKLSANGTLLKLLMLVSTMEAGVKIPAEAR